MLIESLWSTQALVVAVNILHADCLYMTLYTWMKAKAPASPPITARWLMNTIVSASSHVCMCMHIEYCGHFMCTHELTSACSCVNHYLSPDWLRDSGSVSGILALISIYSRQWRITNTAGRKALQLWLQPVVRRVPSTTHGLHGACINFTILI